MFALALTAVWGYALYLLLINRRSMRIWLVIASLLGLSIVVNPIFGILFLVYWRKPHVKDYYAADDGLHLTTA